MSSKFNKTLSTPRSYRNHKIRSEDKLQFEILDAINEILEIRGDTINCAELHRQLVKYYPFATMVYSPDHVLTKIHDMYFDKSGLRFVELTMYDPKMSNTFSWPVDNTELLQK